MNWCMDKYKCLLSFRGSQDKKLSSMSRAFPHSANGQKDMFILRKCVPPLLEPCLELKEARVPLGSTSKRASGGLCSTRALGGSGERLWKRPESGPDAGKPPPTTPHSPDPQEWWKAVDIWRPFQGPLPRERGGAWSSEDPTPHHGLH